LIGDFIENLEHQDAFIEIVGCIVILLLQP
jgi:hypothetical protein